MDLPPALLLLVDKAPALPSVSIMELSSPSPDGTNSARTRHLSIEIVKPSLRTAGKENAPPPNIITSKRTSTLPLSVTKKKKKKKNPATETMAVCDVTNTKKSWEVFRARGAMRKELGLPCLVRNDGKEILGTILE
ncbi:hypothetical protein DFS33DRAFT_1388109 [Desarmillaria ectypa]|nr:hypothetical protein DFS33DRAFT_1388109 [Desarmillaria ectypa]